MECHNDLIVMCTRVVPHLGVNPYGTELPQGLEQAIRKVLGTS